VWGAATPLDPARPLQNARKRQDSQISSAKKLFTSGIFGLFVEKFDAIRYAAENKRFWVRLRGKHGLSCVEKSLLSLQLKCSGGAK
jgi:hypothetical protein